MHTYTLAMANRQGNGRRARNVAMPDENRPSWRPQDDYGPRVQHTMGEDEDRDRERRYRDRERYESDRERYGQHWDELPRRDFTEEPESHYRDDPEAHYRAAESEARQRSMESYGQGQSGYGAGRYGSDRALRSQSRGNQYYPGRSEERSRDRGADDRYTMGRGGQSWSPHDRTDWSPSQQHFDEEDRGSHYLGQSGQEMGEPRERWGRHGSAQPPGPQFREQTRYGTRGYQGYREPGMHRGKGPQGYMRSDERIREAICEVLTDDAHVDATDIEVSVRDGEVTLSGTVEDRYQKRAAEDAIENVSGIRDVHNQIRIGGARSRDSGQESSAHRPREYDDASNGQDRRHRA